MTRFTSYTACNFKTYNLKKEFKNLVQEIEPLAIRKIEKIKDLDNPKTPIIIAFTGASSSGKTYLAKQLALILSEKFPVSYFSQDNYYRCFKSDFESTCSLSDFYKTINFDDPDHFRFNKLKTDLSQLKKSQVGDLFLLPKITFGTDTSFPFIEEEGLPIEVTPVIITEGVYSLTNTEVNQIYDLTFFISMDDDIRKKLWTTRNMKEGRYFNDHMWETTVESLYTHILPSKSQADIVLSNNKLCSDPDIFFKKIFF